MLIVTPVVNVVLRWSYGHCVNTKETVATNKHIKDMLKTDPATAVQVQTNTADLSKSLNALIVANQLCGCSIRLSNQNTLTGQSWLVVTVHTLYRCWRFRSASVLCSREQKFPTTLVPGSESPIGTSAPESKLAREWKWFIFYLEITFSLTEL